MDIEKIKLKIELMKAKTGLIVLQIKQEPYLSNEEYDEIQKIKKEIDEAIKELKDDN